MTELQASPLAAPLYAGDDEPLFPPETPAGAAHPRRRAGGSAPAREPRSCAEALEDVCHRFCGPGAEVHDPACRLIRAELERLVALVGKPRVIPSRRTDPDTSRRAEPARVTADNQRGKLLAAFAKVGPVGLTDEQAATAWCLEHTEYAKRCSELRDAGYIETTGDTRPGKSGQARIVSRITHAGYAAATAAALPDPPE